MQPTLREDRDRDWRYIVLPEVFFLTLLSASLHLFPKMVHQSECYSEALVTVKNLVTAPKNRAIEGE